MSDYNDVGWNSPGIVGRFFVIQYTNSSKRKNRATNLINANIPVIRYERVRASNSENKIVEWRREVRGEQGRIVSVKRVIP
jgi:hypothetical protein